MSSGTQYCSVFHGRLQQSNKGLFSLSKVKDTAHGLFGGQSFCSLSLGGLTVLTAEVADEERGWKMCGYQWYVLLVHVLIYCYVRD